MWATVSVRITGSDKDVNRCVYSGGEVSVTPAGAVFNAPVKHVGQLHVPARSLHAGDTAVGATAIPWTWNLNSIAAGAQYQYANGGQLANLLPGVYHVAGSASIIGLIGANVTIIADGDIHVTGSGAMLNAGGSGILLASIHGSIHITGSGHTLSGAILAPEGEINIAGSGSAFSGPLSSEDISLTGSHHTFG